MLLPVAVCRHQSACAGHFPEANIPVAPSQIDQLGNHRDGRNVRCEGRYSQRNTCAGRLLAALKAMLATVNQVIAATTRADSK